MTQTIKAPDQSAHNLNRTPPAGKDPNAIQRRAADPAASVWVGASAGSGKTKVLTDRLLRLLLPRENNMPGTAPERILCLTFTKAAASEMAVRLNGRLGRWAVMDEAELKADLTKLLGRAPTETEEKAARRLFARVVDTPGGLKIMTIHSFCTSILGRFPLEAGLPPHFVALDDAQAFALLCRARDDILTKARQNPQSAEGKALNHIATSQHEEAFAALLSDVIKENHQIKKLLAHHGSPEKLFAGLYETLGLSPDDDENSLLAAACIPDNFAEKALWEACQVLGQHMGSKTNAKAATVIQSWLEADPASRADMLPAYQEVFLTRKGDIRARLATKAVYEDAPQVEKTLAAEAERLMALDDRIKATGCAAITRDLLIFGLAVLERYETLKHRQAALDFDDLINRTRNLLAQNNMASWVLYKLDGGLDHILVDEAQDTNPEQWEIVQALCDDFFTGHGSRDETVRTVFSVGDEKQSIYSFQRAAPEKFQEMRTYFSDRVKQARQPWRNEAMDFSFRSTPSVLRFVDAVFAPPAVRQGLGLDLIQHESKRAGAAGHVELWPVFETPPKEDKDPWSVPFQTVSSRSGAARLAEHIGDTVADWLHKKEMLASQGRAIEAGDIMILVRRRTSFVNHLIRALKTRDIPVSGVDRMVLNEQLPIQDLLAAAQFALLPTDDLSLACLLKSPLIGWRDEDLEPIATDRTTTLWEALKASKEGKALLPYLKALITEGRSSDPYGFFSYLLHTPCPASEKSGLYAMTARLGNEALDPLDEFLNAALAFERNNVATIQNFLLAMAQGRTDIKREQEEAGGRVRIMTIHGAKGLQAPIVFLPDTVRLSQNPPSASHRLIWPDKSGLNVPLFSPRKDQDCQFYTRLLDDYIARQDEEYRRLLYVALTRAEDRLYIGAYTGRRASFHEESWYNYAVRAMEDIATKETIAFQSDNFWDVSSPQQISESSNVANSDADDTGNKEEPGPLAYFIQNPQIDEVKEPEEAKDSKNTEKQKPPAWLFSPPPPEPQPARPYTPSRPSEPEPAACSPLDRDNLYRFRRGLVTHKLLQYLPDQSRDLWQETAEKFVARHGQDLPAPVQDSIVTETLSVLHDPRCAALFGPQSQAEVPVTGLVGTKLISGQIDRLVVTEKEILIIDYKTNRPPPNKPEAIPALYRNQMKAYSDIVAKIYPGKALRCFLLWTDGPTLMEIRL